MPEGVRAFHCLNHPSANTPKHRLETNSVLRDFHIISDVVLSSIFFFWGVIPSDLGGEQGGEREEKREKGEKPPGRYTTDAFQTRRAFLHMCVRTLCTHVR